FFLRLLRGAGLDGLSAMPASRRLGEGSLQRPLLAHSREQLAAYADEQKLTYIEDPSNADTSLDRNYLRQQVLPLMAVRWSAYRDNIERAVHQLAYASSELEQLRDQPATTLNDWGDPGFSLADTNASAEQLAMLLRAWLKGLALPMPDRSLLVEFIRQLQEADTAAHPRLDSGSYVLQRYRDAVYLLPAPLDWQSPGEVALQSGQRVALAGIGELELVPTQGPGIALAPGQILTVRWREGGERCQPARSQQSMSVKQLMQESAVPPWWRGRLPLLFDGEQLLAVADLCLCRSTLLRETSPAGENNWALAWNRKSLAPEV
ncbi:MAG: tRNA lysidine(34) synthetase TilS, partial [Halieaceae bacterium]